MTDEHEERSPDLYSRLKDSHRRERTLPFANWLPLLAGAFVGIALRLVFSGEPGGIYTAMTSGFIYFSPMLVGMVTVYFAERQKRRGWGYYAWAPIVANLLYVIGTLVALFEGIICAILIVPLFLVLGMAGGLLMGIICRLTNWPRSTLSAFAVVPLVLGAIEPQVSLPEQLGTVERSIQIHASPAEVWSHIESARDIQPEEVSSAWMYRIGVPLPISGETEQTPEGLVRRINMGKHVYFDQVVQEWEPERRVHLTYHFYEDSFPPNALDDHVMIGGDYFDLINTTYTLLPHGDITQLNIRMQYRVSTQFNWYAQPIAEILIGNFEEVILEFYRGRSEGATVGEVRSAAVTVTNRKAS